MIILQTIISLTIAPPMFFIETGKAIIKHLREMDNNQVNLDQNIIHSPI